MKHRETQEEPYDEWRAAIVRSNAGYIDHDTIYLDTICLIVVRLLSPETIFQTESALGRSLYGYEFHAITCRPAIAGIQTKSNNVH